MILHVWMSRPGFFDEYPWPQIDVRDGAALYALLNSVGDKYPKAEPGEREGKLD